MGLALTIVATGINVGGNLHDFEILPRPLSVSLFAALFFTYGVKVALSVDRLVPRADERASPTVRKVLLGVLVAGLYSSSRPSHGSPRSPEISRAL